MPNKRPVSDLPDIGWAGNPHKLYKNQIKDGNFHSQYQWLTLKMIVSSQHGKLQCGVGETSDQSATTPEDNSTQNIYQYIGLMKVNQGEQDYC